MYFQRSAPSHENHVLALYLASVRCSKSTFPPPPQYTSVGAAPFTWMLPLTVCLGGTVTFSTTPVCAPATPKALFTSVGHGGRFESR